MGVLNTGIYGQFFPKKWVPGNYFLTNCVIVIVVSPQFFYTVYFTLTKTGKVDEAGIPKDERSFRIKKK